jgi:hypothetical protein
MKSDKRFSAAISKDPTVSALGSPRSAGSPQRSQFAVTAEFSNVGRSLIELVPYCGIRSQIEELLGGGNIPH